LRAAALALTLAVTASWSQQLWRLWASLWSPVASADNGCHLDPSGVGCVMPSPDNGCHLDPDGRCLPGS
jgi:hypothetical protein